MNIAVILMGLMVLFIAISDIWLIKKYGKPATYSAHIIRFFTKHKKPFLIGVCVGFTMGHLFWSMATESVYPDVKCLPLKEIEAMKCPAKKEEL